MLRSVRQDSSNAVNQILRTVELLNELGPGGMAPVLGHVLIVVAGRNHNRQLGIALPQLAQHVLSATAEPS